MLKDFNGTIDFVRAIEEHIISIIVDVQKNLNLVKTQFENY